jgi:broad specificity phosphatase PhoE
MTTTVFFVRHGSHDRLNKVLCGRMAGVSLGAAGRAEAIRLAERLGREPIEAIYVSPLQRTHETAEPLGERLGLTPVEADELNEVDFGEWTGMAFAELHHQPGWRSWNEARARHRPPGGETLQEVQARVAGWLDGVVERHPSAGVVAICHGDVIKAAVCDALGLSLDHHKRLEISPGSVSVVVAGAWGRKLHSMNEVPQ